MVTRKEVAARAGVSVAVVSYVLNQKNKVREDTKQRVLEAVKALGYQPNLAARSLKTSKSWQIAVLVNDLSNPFEAGLLKYIEAAAGNAGYSVFFQTYVKEQEEQLKTRFMGRVDGILLFGQSLENSTYEHFRAQHIPILSITKPVWERNGLPTIDMNWTAEMRKIVRHLLERGHTKIGFMTNGNLAHHHTQRFQGFIQAMQLENQPLRQEYILSGGGTFEKSLAVMKGAVGLGFSFTALVCANDLMALGVIAACRQAGLSVPGRLAVVGCENVPMAGLAQTPLTTLHYPREQLGKLSIVMLLQSMAGHNVSPCILDGDLMIRESTRI